MYRFETPEQADRFAELVRGTVALKTGRHVYTRWGPVLEHKGAHHPALNPFRMKENAECRMHYHPDMCRESLDILARTVFVTTHPDRTSADITGQIQRIRTAAKEVLK